MRPLLRPTTWALLTCAAMACNRSSGGSLDGRELFVRSGCAACHGPEGLGDGPVARGRNVEGVDLTEPSSFRGGHDPLSIEATIATGRTGERGVMPPHLYLTTGERRALARYVFSLAEAEPTVSLRVQAPWVRLAPPSAPVAGGFVVLHNDGDRPVKLIGASCDASKTVEMHVMNETDGRMTMRQVASFEIPARGFYELRPGGPHLMLIDLMQPLSIDRPVRFILDFDDGQRLELGFPVVAPSR